MAQTNPGLGPHVSINIPAFGGHRATKPTQGLGEAPMGPRFTTAQHETLTHSARNTGIVLKNRKRW